MTRKELIAKLDEIYDSNHPRELAWGLVQAIQKLPHGWLASEMTKSDLVSAISKATDGNVQCSCEHCLKEQEWRWR